ncbi:MAG: hypothetical protein H7Y17_17460 [Chlorobia bacterium]|nr:hypothetical protein [Fimbriimonadaceae bacterium]
MLKKNSLLFSGLIAVLAVGCGGGEKPPAPVTGETKTADQVKQEVGGRGKVRESVEGVGGRG